MADRFLFTRPWIAPLIARPWVACLILLSGLADGTCALAQDEQDPEAARPPAVSRRPGRVHVEDLEGTWIARDYLERLRRSRSPHATARSATGVAIKIRKEGSSYPILITDFQKEILNFVVDLQPDGKPGSYRLTLANEEQPRSSPEEPTYLYLRGERNADGVFQALSIAEPNFARKRFLTYLRLSEPLEIFVNRAVLAGSYEDAEGRFYGFNDSGEAFLPDRSFQYEVSLDPGAAACELILSNHGLEPQGKERIGFEWKGAQLRLYQVKGKRKPYKCAAKPFAVLTRR